MCSTVQFDSSYYPVYLCENVVVEDRKVDPRGQQSYIGPTYLHFYPGYPGIHTKSYRYTYLVNLLANIQFTLQ